jgi:hypothetical protein
VSWINTLPLLTAAITEGGAAANVTGEGRLASAVLDDRSVSVAKDIVSDNGGDGEQRCRICLLYSGQQVKMLHFICSVLLVVLQRSTCAVGLVVLDRSEPAVNLFGEDRLASAVLGDRSVSVAKGIVSDNGGQGEQRTISVYGTAGRCSNSSGVCFRLYVCCGFGGVGLK